MFLVIKMFLREGMKKSAFLKEEFYVFIHNTFIFTSLFVHMYTLHIIIETCRCICLSCNNWWGIKDMSFVLQ